MIGWLTRRSPSLRRLRQAVGFAWRFLRPHRRRLVLGNVLSLLAWGFGTASTLVTASGLSLLLGTRTRTGPALAGLRAGSLDAFAHRFLDAAERWTTDAPPGRVVVLLGLLLLGLTLLTVAAHFAARVLWTRTKFEALTAMQVALFDHLCRLPVAFFAQERVGRLLAPFQRELLDAVRIVQSVSTALLRAPLMAALFLLLLWRTSPGLTAITVAVGAGVLLGFHLIGRLRHGRLRAAYQALGQLLASAQEAFLAIRVVKAFGAEAFVAERFGETAREVARHEERGEILREHLPEALFPLLNLGILVVLALAGSRQVASGELSREGLLLFLAVTVLLGTAAVTVGNALIAVHEMAASSERVRSLLALAPEAPSTGRRPLALQATLSLRDVTFRYGPGFALGPLRLSLERGERLAIVGASGAGKSTLIDLLLRLYEPTGGCIELDGIDVGSLDLACYRRLFGVVAQDTLLLHDTVRANIACGRQQITSQAIEEAARAADADAFIRGLPKGYDTVAGERGLQFSGGQRQRIAIARALAGRPEILLLDEATSALDGDSEAEVLRALSALGRHITIVLVSHRLSAVQGADRIVVLDQGRLVESGTHASLMAAGGTYRRLYEVQAAAG